MASSKDMVDVEKLLSPRKQKVSQPASIWRRGLAFLIDIIILDIFITAPFTSVFADLVARSEAVDALSMTYTGAEIGALFIVFMIMFTYFVLFEYLLKQTPGMMALQLKVEGSGSLFVAILRNIFLFPIPPFIFLWLIEPFCIAVFKRTSMEYLSQTHTTYQREVLF